MIVLYAFLVGYLPGLLVWLFFSGILGPEKELSVGWKIK